ncbi:hypothetical protein ACFY20_45575 [Streptomyces sp. NPDC001312]|uniref:hypothetical protein n=1 Tax=Streptomyces sp. NPDC001312 TaxID=3364561 RepID=UPI0036836F69
MLTLPVVVDIGGTDSGRGGADPLLVAEFLDFVRHGAATQVSPVAAREAAAASCATTESLRRGGAPVEVTGSVCQPVLDRRDVYRTRAGGEPGIADGERPPDGLVLTLGLLAGGRVLRAADDAQPLGMGGEDM